MIDSFTQGYNYVGGVAGDVYNATITNCYNTGAVNSSSSSYSYVGGVVGCAYGATITNCYNTGSVSGSSSNVGGVVGYANSSLTIANCYNTGSVSGSSDVGGVAGTAIGDVTNCYNIGSVSGSSDVGGVAGNAQSSSTITNCYNTGSVSGSNSFVGGVAGAAYGDVTNCYNTGSVSASNSFVGGVVGYVYSNTTITNTYYGGDCEAIGGIKGADVDGQAEYLADLEVLAKNEEWYLNSSNWNRSYPWNFETVWNISVVFNGGYPCFDAFWTDKLAQNQLGVDFDNYTLTQDTSASTTTYLIQSETDLAFLSWTIYNDQVYGGSDNKYTSGSDNYFYSDVYFKQTTNLDLSAYYWQPIGIYRTRSGTSVWRYFSGNYDGGGHTVSGVFTPAGSGYGYYYQGLFGYIDGRSSTQRATIANVGVIDSFVQGNNYVGGVVGYVDSYATVSNVYNTGSVSGSSNVGGVVGYAYDNTRVINVYNTGSVSGSSIVGGVAGSAFDSTISNAYNTGSVSGTGDYVGGVVGSTRSTVNNVYNTGSVSGSSNVGGVVGNTISSTVRNAYNTGSVSGSSNVGGVVGYANRTVSNVYNTGSVSGNSDVGGVVGYISRSATISDCGVECAVITGTSNVGIFVGRNASSSAKIKNCYAIVNEALSPYGSNSGTFTNCLWIVGGVKYYLGTDFSGFAWPNADSCPIPKGLSWIGQFWTKDITSQIMSSSGWTEWVA